MSSDPESSPQLDQPADDAGDPAASGGEERLHLGSGSGQGAVIRHSRRKLRRRIFAVAFGLSLPLFMVECGARVLWKKLVLPSETPLMQGRASLGRALIEESLRGPGESIRSWKGDHALYVADDHRSLRLKPNVDEQVALPAVPGGHSFHVTSDPRGLRGPVEPPAAAGTLKVLCVGDSMTFGEGVDDADTYPHRLQLGLAKELGRPVRVYNAGVISLGQVEQRDVVRQYVRELQPDVLLMQFTTANDVVDNWRWLDQDGPLKHRRDACETLEHHILLINPLARWSRAYRLGVWRWGRHAIKYRFMVEEPNLDRSAKLLLDLAELGRELRPGLKVGVLIAPSVVQVERGFAETLLRTHRINDGIAERMKEADVPVLDLLPGLRERADAGASLYIPVDRHWNPEGSQAVGELLVPFVKEIVGGS